VTDPILVVSPHLDDAVLSVGQLIDSRPCCVATVLTGTPLRRSMRTPFDVAAGFNSANLAMKGRRHEDASALVGLNATSIHLGLLDSQYSGGQPPAHDLLCAAIAQAADQALAHLPEQVLLAPLGLAHPDHVAVADACADLAARRPELQLWVYEELPARIVWPELVEPRLQRLRDLGWNPTLAFMGTGSIHAKHAAIICYRSQLAALDTLGHFPHTVLAPERTWRCWPA
jgi:LmbE family N-acetylglucosaminyl deacetylase